MDEPTFFTEIADLCGLAPNVRSYILEEMAAPHRHYHTMRHLEMMLNSLTGYVQLAQANMSNEVCIALLFHDIVYDPTRDDNEEMSGIEMKLRISSDDVNFAFVERLILATRGHDLSLYTGANTTAENSVIYDFVKADLSILWAQGSTYRWYAQGIRNEYAHVPDELYLPARRDVLYRLSESLRPHLHDHRDTERMEDNLRDELRALKDGLLHVR